MKRPKIAYVTLKETAGFSSWSISANFMGEMLQKYVGDVYNIGYSMDKPFWIDSIKRVAYGKLLSKIFFIERTEKAGTYYAKQVQDQLKQNNYDIIFSLGTIPIAYLNSSLPIVIFTDATFACMAEYYWKNIVKETIQDANKMESLALRKAAKLLYSSRWAANSAIRDYNIDPHKVYVVPNGANLRQIPERHALKQTLSNPINILFIGADWERKGGSIALDVLHNLHNNNVNAVLHIVGCHPNIEINPWMRIYGLLNKNNPDHLQRLSTLFTNADLFLLPSKEECYGVVACEANAYGIPVLAHNTGGVSTIVTHGKNGFLSDNNTAEEYTEFVLSAIRGDVYQTLRSEARLAFETRLNWDVWGKTVAEIVSGLFNGDSNNNIDNKY